MPQGSGIRRWEQWWPVVPGVPSAVAPEQPWVPAPVPARVPVPVRVRVPVRVPEPLVQVRVRREPVRRVLVPVRRRRVRVRVRPV